jgi:hypothetical protein
MIRVEAITDGISKEIDRLVDGPTLTDYLEFERVLMAQYAATQQAVHVITGSLKLSGKTSSSFGQNKWEGEISYGGVSEGVYNPVKYAEYERERDGSHDFLAPARDLDRLYLAAMNHFLGG